MQPEKHGLRREDVLFMLVVTLVCAGGVNTIVKPSTPVFALAGVVASLVSPVRHLARRVKGSRGYRPPIGAVETDAPIAAAEAGAPVPARRAQECIIVGPDRSEPTLDVLLAVSPPDGFAGRVRFATTETLVRDITRLNMYGYADTPYGADRDRKLFDAKLARNREIARRNPYALAAVVDESNPELYLGFTSIVPLTSDGSRRYLNAPGVRDNDLTGGMVARRGVPFSCALLFAIAQMKMLRGFGLHDLERGEMISREPDVAAVSDLSRLLAYQLGVVAAVGNVREEFQLVGQSTVGSVRKQFSRMGMVPAPHIVTADGEPAFQALLQVRRVDAARAALDPAMTAAPELDQGSSGAEARS
jgi:hypothetical protein